MGNDKLAAIWKTQKSLTEWLEDIKHKDAAAIRREDNDKRERLGVINEVTGLPFDKPMQFDGQELADKSPALTKYLQEHGEELCALRLMPKVEDLPKLRMRGKTVTDAYDWFLEQDIDAGKYKADFVPHAENTSWATIFVVNKHGVQGEIIKGGHHQLTQGFHEDNTPHVFRYDFKDWRIEPEDNDALEHLKTLAAYLHVSDKAKQETLKEKLGATFANDYLEGYFETSNSAEFGTWFIDYSQSLGKMYEDMVVQTSGKTGGLVKGQVGSPGKAKGPVKIVQADNIDADFPDGAVLVCAVTTPDYVPLMQKAAAIITDQGGILSHAAIVARELKKPCIVGTGNATKVLKEGQIVSVDADKGTVSISQ
ncbi:MAG: hypothetical protein JWO96_522 [Candidatus Saccharibacteria bacterium]|nr:hypothetical protein [Candidatus Saccharibacteria bacterium]